MPECLLITLMSKSKFWCQIGLKNIFEKWESRIFLNYPFISLILYIFHNYLLRIFKALNTVLGTEDTEISKTQGCSMQLRGRLVSIQLQLTCSVLWLILEDKSCGLSCGLFCGLFRRECTVGKAQIQGERLGSRQCPTGLTPTLPLSLLLSSQTSSLGI